MDVVHLRPDGHAVHSRTPAVDHAALKAGMNGCELARQVLYDTHTSFTDMEDAMYLDKSPEYWAGWAIAYYQWFSARKFNDIFKAIPFDDLQKMYYTLHEADISKFVDIADKRIKEHFNDTNLKRIRTAYGCSQAKLAKLSGVSLRSIQMYEQRKKNINKASADALYNIAKVLGCTMEDLLEN